MEPQVDHYALLGVSAGASPEAIQQAYRVVARRFHPDANADLNAADEFKRINEAYALLNDPQQRALYDEQRAAQPDSLFKFHLTPSRTVLPAISEPQVVYLLLEIGATEVEVETSHAPLNVCMVVDRSTSMQGVRLERVRAAMRRAIEYLQPDDIFSVVAFSDRAEVVLSAQKNVNKARAISKVSTIRASGGTEILQGLAYGLTEVHRNHSPRYVNHLILLTDGRTYGDEKDCLLLAQMAYGDGIAISGIGIGDEWNDVFLDQLANITGGISAYIETPAQVSELLHTRIRQMGGAFAERIQVQVTPDPEVALRTACKLAPDPQPLDTDLRPFRLGILPVGSSAALLLELVLLPHEPGSHKVARLTIMGNVLRAGNVSVTTALDFGLPVQAEVQDEPPPLAIVQALSKLTLYQMQEKARKTVASGNLPGAKRILETLAARLLASGEQELAYAALEEAERIGQTQSLSSEGHKRLKYGTRALIVPPTKTT